jgi:arylsulfatase A-like enzyme
MKYPVLLLSAFMLLNGCGTSTERSVGEKPNVLLVLTDDQGSVDLKCYGAEDLETPNLDRLAENGVRFTQFYSGSSICSPSRACILTGRTPQGAGLATNAPSRKGNPGMPGEQVTIAEVFKKAGYVTGHIGKWHLGYSEETMPRAQGFDHTFGHMGGCIDNYSHFFYWGGPNRHDLWENGREIFLDGEFFPDIMAGKAETYIREHAGEPFFLYFALNTPHYPLQPYEKWREAYRELTMPRRDYAAFVSTCDEIIGRLLSALDREGLRERTIIMFLSDQGHSCEERTFGGGGSAGPYRGCKFSLFEGGIRVPAIISWKNTLAAGKTVDEVCHAMDILPTLAGLAGVEDMPESVEGRDLSGLISGEGIPGEAVTPHDVLFWQLGKQWAVRKGDWKLVGNPVDPSRPGSLDDARDSLFLVNLAVDISESTNLAGSEPGKLEELYQLYSNWEHAHTME